MIDILISNDDNMYTDFCAVSIIILSKQGRDCRAYIGKGLRGKSNILVLKPHINF